MRRFVVRGLIAAALTVATLAAPVATVHACSCVGLTTPEAVEAADLAFVGTVADSIVTGQDPMLGVPLVRYAFEVERASQPTGSLVEVAAHDDGGGASCGFSFGVGERWLVAAHSEGGDLRSTLCSGNQMLADIGDAEMAQLIELLPMEPVPATPRPEPAPAAAASNAGVEAPILAGLVGLAAAVALAAVMVVALRRGRPS